MSQNSKPLVITAGEPAGIGPELCLALAASDSPTNFILVSDIEMLRARAQQMQFEVALHEIGVDEIAGWQGRARDLAVINIPFADAVACGQPSAKNAPALIAGLTLAAEACVAGRCAALVTAPLAKQVIADSGIAFSGHTEFLAELTGAQRPVMLLVAGDLRVALASTHIPLRDVADYITQRGLREVLECLHEGLRTQFGIDSPDIVVCGLNPHAGEGGYLGSEDSEIIAPVIAALRERGMTVRGPLPADTAFTPAAGHPDVVLAMYHDQGLPVLKYAGFGHAVNVTLGLPIIRTSVDHGTAFDIAGGGSADSGSLQAAIELARDIACRQ